MVIFNSYVKLPEGNRCTRKGTGTRLESESYLRAVLNCDGHVDNLKAGRCLQLRKCFGNYVWHGISGHPIFRPIQLKYKHLLDSAKRDLTWPDIVKVTRVQSRSPGFRSPAAQYLPVVHPLAPELMAAVAPCAYYGCGCGHPGHIGHIGHMAAFQQSGMVYPTYAPQHLPVKLRLHRLLLELKPLEEKYWEAQQLVQQMAAHEVGLWVQAILEKPLPMRWMHNLSIHILGELLQLYPAIVTSEFGKVGMAQNYV